ncbi:KH domain-containing protein [Ditylenchus destructor]|nr:KH domain-containing protein [Ditylenchus destructor]
MSKSTSALQHDINDALNRAKQLAAANSNGQKRSINDELNFQPAKRPNSGSNMAGMVIGRGGSEISNIQQTSGCRVQMAGDSNGTGVRQCTLQGPKHCIDKARQMIAEVLDRSRGGGNGNQNGSGGGFVTTELMIPGPKCGLIIGKSGETIKGLQETIGVKMLLIQDTQQVSMGPKPLRITGFPDKVEQAKRIVEQLLNSEDGQAGHGMIRPGPRSIGEVIVPRSSVGIIIGKGGETIKRLGAESGAKIQFKPDDDPNAQDRCAIIQGSPEQINRATQMISELVTRSAHGGGGTETFYMHVPANKTGLVIGKGGDTIKQICGETAAHVELSREPPPNPNEKVFVIKGTPYQIHHVQHIIRIKVGDIAPGTPVPPFQGAGGPGQFTAGNPFGPTTHQFGGGDQFGAAQWAQNSNGGANPNTGAAPAINPQTGQPDYSAQWAEYYRQMGMHDQAGLIEAQMKQQQGQAQPRPQAYYNS